MMGQVNRTVQEFHIVVFDGCPESIIHLSDRRCEYDIRAPFDRSICCIIE